jgi:hypothetical protein
MLNVVTEYLERHPEEAGELGPILAGLEPLEADDLCARLWCTAILLDKEGRVFQRKATDSWVWSMPGESPEPSDSDVRAAAERALGRQSGMETEVVSQLRRPIAYPIEITAHPGSLRLYFVMTTSDDLPPFAPDIARMARWAPTDFLWNASLAQRVAAL